MSIYVSRSDNPKVVGIIQAIESLTSSVSMWDSPNLPLFDLLEEKKPTAIFLHQESDSVLNTIKYAKHEFPDTKFILFREDSSIEVEGVDLYLDLNDHEKEWFIPYLANTLSYFEGESKPQYETDILIFSNRLDPKSEAVNDWIAGLGTKYRLKIYGNIRLHSVYYLGNPLPHEYKDIIQSAKVIVSFDEEWFYTTLHNGKIPISYNNVQELAPWEFNNYQQLNDLCDEALTAEPDWLTKWHSDPPIEDASYTYKAYRIKEELKI